MIVRLKMIGTSTKKNELIANFRPGGLSETLHWFKRLLIESKIRIQNKQNFIFVLILFVLTFINHFRNIIFRFFKFLDNSNVPNSHGEKFNVSSKLDCSISA